ncbi:MAG: 23S rRNA (pseudouridine(1915)-N(3))-methyltransferase RlmH [Clostridia bacterium]|nr:23S rRNA (pseudouridine(1915)-N(3))-methyltransferase RlmH [Clostridia bacterium]
MKCTVYCSGNLKEKYWRDAEAEYAKRMKRFGGWNVVELPEAPLPERPSQKEIDRALEKEGEALLKKLPAQAYPIALCVEGKQRSSEALAALLEEIPQTGKSEIALIIGSSHGLAETVKKACRLRLSVSPMTFPHQMMRVILAEQFYRAHKINANESYHK